MGATTLKRRVGSLLEHNTFVGANREITVVEDVNGLAYELRLHNGVTPGGLKVGGSGSSTGLEITIESFDSSAGTGGDDTVAFRDARALAALVGGVLKMLPGKTYLIDPIDVNTPYQGSNYTIDGSGSELKAYTTGQPIGTVAMLPLQGDNLKVTNLVIDGAISDDPANWSTGYNSFTGACGLWLSDSDGFELSRVYVNNVVFGGISGRRVSNGKVSFCSTNRTRGNFGDGFYFVGHNILFEGNRAYDHTRIGFVLETNVGLLELTGQSLFINCHAEYGHDCSALYGGIEGNYGFWYENFKHVTTLNCTAKRMNRLTGGGFKSVPSIPDSAGSSMEGILYCNNSYINCIAEDCRYGFDMNSIDEEYRNLVKLQNCSALKVSVGLYVGQRSDYQSENVIDVENFSVLIDEYTTAARGIMWLGGNINVDGLFIKFDDSFNQTAWDDENDGYSAVGAFSTQAGYKAIIKDAHVFLEDNTEIPVNFKFRSNETRANVELEVLDTWVKNVNINCKSIKYFDCRIDEIGQEAAQDELLYERCHIVGVRDVSRPVSSYSTHVRPVTFNHCRIDLPDAEYFYAYIPTSNGDKKPAFVFNHCEVYRNFETHSYALRLNAETAVKNTYDEAFNYEFNFTKFINTGGATTNPIIFTDGVEADRFTALGIGNQKSSTLSVDGSPTLLPLYLPVPFGKLKVEPTAITASRNLTSNDFNKTMQNSTSTAIVLTLGVNQEALAPIGTEIELTKLGTGNVNFTPTAPSTVNGTTTFAVTTQYSSRKVRKVGSAAWVTV